MRSLCILITKILGTVVAHFFLIFTVFQFKLFSNNGTLFGAPGNRTPLKNYDFKFCIKIYWFLSSILYDCCFFSSSIKSLENEKYKRYISIYVCYLHHRSYLVVDLWNNYIRFANNISKCCYFNIIFVHTSL